MFCNLWRPHALKPVLTVAVFTPDIGFNGTPIFGKEYFNRNQKEISKNFI